MKKKITTIFLVIALVLTLIPSAAFAADNLIKSLQFVVSTRDNTPYTMAPAWGTNSSGEYTVTVPDYSQAIYFNASFDSGVCIAAKSDAPKAKIGTIKSGTPCMGMGVLTKGSAGGKLYLAAIRDTSITDKTYDGIAKKTGAEKYTINFARKLTLTGLDISAGEMLPKFAKDTYDYTVNVPEDIDEITVSPTGVSPNYKIKINVNGNTDVGAGEVKVPLAKQWQDNKCTITATVTDGTENSPNEETVYTLNLNKIVNNEPVISPSNQNAAYYGNEKNPSPLTIEAKANGTLSYQWYKADSRDGEGTIITGADEKSYTPVIGEVGSDVTEYYYCIVTNTKDSGETFPKRSDYIAVTTKVTPYPDVKIYHGENGVPQDGIKYEYNDETAKPLKVTASEPTNYKGGNFSYQWYRASSEDLSDAGIIAGAKSNEFKDYFAIGSEVGRYYFCKVTYEYDSKEFTRNSDAAYVSVYGATPPVVNVFPNKAERTTSVNSDVDFTFTVAGGSGTMYYQWFHSTDGKKFSPITDKPIEYSTNGAAFRTPKKSEPSVDYYYCRGINKVESRIMKGETFEAITDSPIIKVTSLNTDLSLEGAGTEDKPYLIKSYDDLKAVQSAVEAGASFEGVHFLFKDNVDLAADWVPIGINNDTYFRGTIDGGGHQLTVAKGGKSLLGYTQNATVKNLVIYGEQIDGYGLVENYVVSRATKVIDIIDVRIKTGSKIKMSGFIGGYASGKNNVLISNCTVDEGVTIGYTKDQDHIGSFAGELNGTIINCTSKADVYGKNCVGGIVGNKGQSMGEFVVRNCSFDGTVTATGEYAGGIVGAGYDGNGTAPNTPGVTIQNCRSNAAVQGKDKVGGILGGEPDLAQCWDNGIGYIQNNLFTGTINCTDGMYVGGTIGYMTSLNKYTVVTNNYYREETASKGIGFIKYIDTSAEITNVPEGVVVFNTGTCSTQGDVVSLQQKTGVPGLTYPKLNRTDDPLGSGAYLLSQKASVEELKNGSIASKLNAGDNSFQNWEKGDDYPVLSTEPVAYKLTISGDYKTEYHVGDRLNTDNMVLTLSWSNGKQTNILPKEAEISGFTTSSIGIKTVKVKYGVAEASFEIRVTKVTPAGVTAYLTVYGDSAHGNTEDASGTVHTLRAGNLKPWVARTAYSVTENTTVKDVLQTAAEANKITLQAKAETKYGYYLEGMTKNGEYLGEFTNGNLSGWMYTVNGSHPEVSMGEYFVKNGDNIIVHYTDDYTKEEGSEKWNTPVEETKNVTTSGASGSATTTSPTEVKVSGTTAAATVKAENQSEILKQATENKSAEIILEVSKADSKGADSVQLSLDVTFVKNIADKTNADLTVNTENGKVTLDQETLKTIIGEAKGNTVIIEITKVTKPTEVQKKAAGANGDIFSLLVKSGDKIISNFNKGKATVTVEIPAKLQDKKVAAIYIAEDGKIEQLEGKTVKIDGKDYYIFETPHFSTFALVDAEELGLEVNDEEANIVKIKELVSDMSMKARSSKTSKKNINVNLTVDKSTAAAIKEIEDMGYTVKYKYYRSTKKASKYQAKITKTTKTFTNTAGKKGTRYYYKARIQVYDKDGKLVAQTALKQCKYAVRTWTK